MTQEEKSILLKDLCARLPYKIKIKFAFNKDIEKNNNLIYVSDDEQSYIHNGCMVLTEDNIKYVFNNWLDEYKPYLRPMSSMTEEEKKELKELHFFYADGHIVNDEDNNFKPIIVDELHCSCIIDWLNAHHFDYRGLVEKGLALEAKEGIYKIDKL